MAIFKSTAFVCIVVEKQGFHTNFTRLVVINILTYTNIYYIIYIVDISKIFSSFLSKVTMMFVFWSDQKKKYFPERMIRMKTLYLHIGTPKTGTTAIQNFLNDNKGILQKLGFCYPMFDVQYKVQRKVRNGHWLIANSVTPEEYEACMKRLCAVSKNYSKIILTDEGLWNRGGPDAEFWKKLKQTMDAHKVQIKVIVYLRRQDDYVFSYWAQKVKGVQRFNILFDDYLYSGSYKQNHVNYLEILNTIASVIGTENVIVRAYESGQYEGAERSLLSDFLLQLGLEWQDNFQIIKRSNNISLKDSVLEAKRLLNLATKFKQQNGTLKSYLEQIQNEMQQDGTLKDRTAFDIPSRQKFLQKYEAENAEIARKFMHRKNGILFYQRPEDNGEDAVFTREEISRIYDRLLELNQADPNALYSKEELQKITEKALKHFDAQHTFKRRCILKVKHTLRSFQTIK